MLIRMRAVILLAGAALLVAACGSGTRRVTVTRTPPTVVCPTGEVRVATGECIPARLVKVPGVEGSGVKPSGAQPAAPPSTFGLFGRSIQISGRGLRLIEGFEGFESCPYWDAYGGVWTRGYGETEGISRGSACISRSFGESNLRYRVERFYQWAIRGLAVDLNQNQVDALDSFAWNLGAGIFTGSLRYTLQHRQFYAAASIMLGYVHAGGQVLSGLVRRRYAERALFLSAAAPERRVTRAQKVKRLRALYRVRQRERRVIARRQCQPGDHRHALPHHGRRQARRSRAECNGILRAGARHNREIARLHREGIR